MIFKNFIGVDDLSMVEPSQDDEAFLAALVPQLLDLTRQELHLQLLSQIKVSFLD